VKIFNAQVLNKYNVNYYQCRACGFAQTEAPYWLNESYQSSLNLSDTGLMHRCERMSKITTSIISLFFNKKGRFLDFAGGLGLFTRTMRDIGLDFYWHDLYTKNEVARGFEGQLGEKYDLVTSFESFEHFENPLEEIENLLKMSKSLLITTDLISIPAPLHKDWWYYASEHGQHIAFHSKKSCEFLAKKNGLKYYNFKNVHFFTDKKLPFFKKLLITNRFSKEILYLLFFVFNFFLKSKSIDDMNSFYNK
jgi:hypothetical protein